MYKMDKAVSKQEDRLLVTVVVITYNHEKYIADAIKSVLNQTFAQFEIVIVNDGSWDKTEAIIKSFHDERIKYLYQNNQGPSTALNNAIKAASGKYVAIMSGDDICHPDRLQKQLNYLLSTKEKKIVFSRVSFIDDANKNIECEWGEKIFNTVKNRTRSECFRHLFFEGNFLNAPTCMLEKSILLDEGLFNVASIQLQDFDMWLKLIKKYDFYIFEEKLLKYRIRSNNENLSLNPANVARVNCEIHFIMKNVLENISIDYFKEAFLNDLRNKNFKDNIEFELEKAFLYLAHASVEYRFIGLEKLFYLLQDENVLKVARKTYCFDLKDFYRLAAETDFTYYGARVELKVWSNNQAAIIEELYNTSSWKITKPLRVCCQFLKDFWRKQLSQSQ